MKKYQKLIGDGKLPNKYWVFHYDEKFTKRGDELVSDNDKAQGGLIGEYSTYKRALEAVDNKAFFPHVVIEDRLTGQVFETICIVCPCCNKEDWETMRDIQFTKNTMEKRGIKFE
jgi:hypothetical protein